MRPGAPADLFWALAERGGDIFALAQAAWRWDPVMVCGSCVGSHVERLSLARSRDGGASWEAVVLGSRQTPFGPLPSGPPSTPPVGLGGHPLVDHPMAEAPYPSPDLWLGADGSIAIVGSSSWWAGSPAGPWQPATLPPLSPRRQARTSSIASCGGNRLLATVQGALLRSEDGGRTYAALDGLDPARGKNLFAVDTAPSGTAFAVGMDGLVLRRAPGGGWSPTQTPTDRRLLSVLAVDDTLVLAAGDGTLLRAVDGGHTFAEVPLPTIVRVMGFATKQHLPADLAALAHSPAGLFAAGTDGAVLRSTDRGATWTALPTGTDRRLIGLATVGQRVIALRAHGEGLQISEDGGDTWRHEEAPAATHVQLVAGAMVLVTTGGGLVRSRDGVRWDVLPVGNTAPLRGVWAQDRRLVVAADREVHRSDDGGDTWRHEAMPLDRVFGLGGGDGALFVVGDKGGIVVGR